jgi:hypothetical protein
MHPSTTNTVLDVIKLVQIAATTDIPLDEAVIAIELLRALAASEASEAAVKTLESNQTDNRMRFKYFLSRMHTLTRFYLLRTSLVQFI